MEEFRNLDESVSADAAEADDMQAMLADQLQKIRDYRMNEFCVDACRNSALRSIAADMMEVEAHVSHTLRAIMRDAALTLDDIEDLTPTIDMRNRLIKHIGQIVTIESRSVAQPPRFPLPPR
jgi:hypothetical protein